MNYKNQPKYIMENIDEKLFKNSFYFLLESEYM